MKILEQNEINSAAEILKSGGLVSFPTETVFGLGVIFDNEESYKNLIAVKKRPPEKPFTLMCSRASDIEKYAQLDDLSRFLIKKYVPGQITLLLKAKSNLPSWVVSSEGFVGVRVPDSNLIQNLISLVGKPLLVPSANKSGEKPAYCHEEVVTIFGDEIDAVIKGESKSNIPSTIVLVDKTIKIIREGVISKNQIEESIKEEMQK